MSFSVFEASGKFITDSGQLPIKNQYVRWTTTVERGKEYKVRAFTYNVDGDKSGPGDYSGVVGTIPSAVSGITSIKAVCET